MILYASGDLTLTFQYFYEVRRVCLFVWMTNWRLFKCVVGKFIWIPAQWVLKCFMRANKFKIVWLLTQTTRTNSKKLRLNGIVAIALTNYSRNLKTKFIAVFKTMSVCIWMLHLIPLKLFHFPLIPAGQRFKNHFPGLFQLLHAVIITRLTCRSSSHTSSELSSLKYQLVTRIAGGYLWYLCSRAV